jgi:hypothetical protein
LSLGGVVAAKRFCGARFSWNNHAVKFVGPTKEQERELNWRLQKELSPGLIGEIGLHQCDVVSWFLNARPKAVTGFGGILSWDDGRDVPDTVQAVFEFPGGANLTYDATLANSFDSDYEILYGTDSAVMLRHQMRFVSGLRAVAVECVLVCVSVFSSRCESGGLGCVGWGQSAYRVSLVAGGNVAGAGAAGGSVDLGENRGLGRRFGGRGGVCTGFVA